MSPFAQLSDVLEAARRLGAALEARGAMIATAESCTGGLIATALTELAGSSRWFERGFVTYSNDAKHELLGVPRAMLADHGAVSEPVARAMAEGALARSRAGLALAVTGVAGPGGASADKPVGMVCFAWALAADVGPLSGARPVVGTVVVETARFQGDRAAVRGQTAHHALARALALVRSTGASTAQAP